LVEEVDVIVAMLFGFEDDAEADAEEDDDDAGVLIAVVAGVAEDLFVWSLCENLQSLPLLHLPNL